MSRPRVFTVEQQRAKKVARQRRNRARRTPAQHAAQLEVEKKQRRDRKAADPEKYNAKKRLAYARLSPVAKQNVSLYMYAYGLNRRFKITLVRWLALFAQQGERCACCRTPVTKRRWHTDHDHKTGEIRGILCCGCNTTLGRLGDTLDKIEVTTLRFVSYPRGGTKPADASDPLVPYEPE